MKPERAFGHGMPRDVRSSATPQLVVGIFIMTLGVLLTLDRLDILNAAARFLRFWPLGLVAMGAVILSRRADAGGRFWGFLWLIVGSWLLLNTLGLVRVGFWELFWPLVLVLVGLNLIRQTLRRGGGSSRTSSVSGNLFAVMGESKRTLNAEPFHGASMTAFMGGCMLDLRQATMAPGEEAIVDVFAIMAGHEILVPAGWTVVPDVVPLLAGVDDKRLPGIIGAPLAPGEMPPRLVLKGILVMAGLTIKS